VKLNLKDILLHRPWLLRPLGIIISTAYMVAGFRWADRGWVYKWYRKTDHGLDLEKKIDKKIRFQDY